MRYGPLYRRLSPALGVLACALLTQRAAGSAMVLHQSNSQESAPGFLVLHFPGACLQDAKSAIGARTHFREYNTANGARLAISGQVALRFKAATSARQIDSLIAATGIEVFTSRARPACRRYVFAVAQPESDPAALARALENSGLVEYATPDFGADRSEGIATDSFFVDQVALSNAINKTSIAADTAPATFGMGQVLSQYVGPVLRVDAAMSAQLSAVSASTTARDVVKAHGLPTLRLDVPEQNTVASVRVVLYSLSGTPVRQLVNASLEAGRYLVGWDGNDDKGRRVQPGVYVAVMTAGNFRETRRLVVR